MPHLKFLIVGILIVGAISYLMFSGINDSMVYYYTVSEMLQKRPGIDGKGIRVSGHVSPGTIRRETARSRVQFAIWDRQTEQSVPVIYQGIIPDTFKDGAEVVVEGAYHGEEAVFQANVLLAKCPSKYEAQGEEHPEHIPIPGEVTND